MIHSAEGAPAQEIRWPVLEAHLTYHHDGAVREWVVPSCCFHDLASENDEHLAGMGLAILGNVVKLCQGDLYDEALGATLRLRRYPADKGVECPWPGMPDAAPLPLDLMRMPFDGAMFLDEPAEKFTHRVDRLQLLARINEVWVPWLRSQLILVGVG